MRYLILSSLFLGCGSQNTPSDTSATDTAETPLSDSGGLGEDTGQDTDTQPVVSAGCGLEPAWLRGGAQLEFDAGAEGDGVRGAYLVLPSNYDPDVPHRLVFGFPGTNWVGSQIRGYLNLEGQTGQPEIYVYPDPLWRSFQGWGTYGGWVLGPHANPAQGMGDLNFVESLY